MFTFMQGVYNYSPKMNQWRTKSLARMSNYFENIFIKTDATDHSDTAECDVR
jgi:hypothetical protein